MPMQYTLTFKVVKYENFQWKFYDIFLIFAQNIDCGYTLEPPVLLYKSGVQGGIHYTDMFS